MGTKLERITGVGKQTGFDSGEFENWRWPDATLTWTWTTEYQRRLRTNWITAKAATAMKTNLTDKTLDVRTHTMGRTAQENDARCCAAFLNKRLTDRLRLMSDMTRMWICAGRSKNLVATIVNRTLGRRYGTKQFNKTALECTRAMKARPARTSQNGQLELALRKCSYLQLCSWDTNNGINFCTICEIFNVLKYLCKCFSSITWKKF